ncbi:hypothetical protein [Enterobacter vonholyi]
MKFQLIKNQIESLNIQPFDDESSKKNNFSFSHTCRFNEALNKEFVISFGFELVSGNKFKLNFVHNFFFEADEIITEDFLKSHYTSVNAPAIAYPYVRAFVATLLLNAGLESVLLPAVNFVEHAKMQEMEQRK